MEITDKKSTSLARFTSGQQRQREHLGSSDDLLYAYLVRHKNRHRTYGTYLDAVSEFFGTDRVSLAMASQVSDEMVNNYIQGMMNSRTGEPASNKTKAVKLSAIRGFYKWLGKKRLLSGDDNPFTGDIMTVKISRSENPIVFLSVPQVRAMLEATVGHGEASVRNYTMILMLVYLGLRRSELVKVCCEDFTMQGVYHVLRLPHTKGGENQSVKVPGKILEAVKRHREHYGITGGPLFLSLSRNRRGEPIRRGGTIRDVIKRAVADAGLSDEIAVHTMRHSAATIALEGGANIRQVQTFLRHKNIQTTMIYAHQRDKLAESAVDHIHI